MMGQQQGMDRPVIVVVAAHRRRQKSWATNAAEAFVGVPTMLGRHGFYFVS